MKRIFGLILSLLIVSMPTILVSAQSSGTITRIEFPGGRPNCSGRGSVFISYSNPNNSPGWITATTGMVSQTSVGFGSGTVSLQTDPTNNVFDGVFKIEVRFGPQVQSSQWFKSINWFDCATGQSTPVGVQTRPDEYDLPSDLTSLLFVGTNDTSRLTINRSLLVTAPTNGTATYADVGFFNYTPNPGFVGRDSFIYRSCNIGGFCNDATVTIDVFQRPRPTVTAVRLVETTCEAAGILEVDLRYDGDEAWVTANSAIEDLEDITTTDTFLVGDRTISMDVSSAGVVIDGFAFNVRVRYGPSARSGEYYDEDFWFDCNTGARISTDITAFNDSFTVPEDFSVVYNVTSNDDSDLPLDFDSLSITEDPNRGTVSVGANGNITYTLTDGEFSGTDSFVYQICNVDNTCDTATVTVSIEDLPAHEITNISLAQTSCDGLAILDVSVIYSGRQGWLTSKLSTSDSILNITSDDLDSFGDEFTFPMELNVTPADLVDGNILRVETLYGTSANDATYDSEINFYDCETGLPIDKALSAFDDTLTVAESFPRSVNVVTNDQTDLPIDNSTLRIVTDPARGTATPVGNGEIQYQLTDGEFSGTDSFVYEICNIADVCDTATVTISVIDLPPHEIISVNIVEITCDALGSVDVTVQYSGNQGFVTVETGITEFEDITSNAFEDFTERTVNLPISAENGAVSGDNVLTMNVFYGTSPSDDTYDNETLYFDCVTGEQITPTVNAVDDDGGEVESADELEIDILANDESRLPLDTDTLQILSEPAGGEVVIQADSTVLFTPDPNFAGTTTFDYEICNTGEFCDTATVTIQVVDVTPECDVLTPREEMTIFPPREIIVVLVDNIDYNPTTGDIFYDILGVTRVVNGVPSPMRVSDIDWGVRKDLINAETSGYQNWRSYAVYYAPPGPYPRNCAGTAYVYVNATVYANNCRTPAVDLREIRYDVGDDNSDFSATDCVTGLPPNDIIFAVNDYVQGAESGASVSVDVLENDQALFSFDLATLEIITEPSGATASVVGDQITVDIGSDTTGTVTLTYQICTVSGSCDNADVIITVGGMSVASARSAGQPEPMQFSQSPPNNEPSDVAVVPESPNDDAGSPPNDSTVVVEEPNDNTTPGDDTGSTPTDPSQPSTPTPTPVPTDPIVVALDETVTRSDSSAPSTINVLGNDVSNYDWDLGSLTITSNPSIGSASVQNGTVVFVGNGTQGSTTFVYSICNVAGGCDSATVTVILASTTDECDGYTADITDGTLDGPVPDGCELDPPPITIPPPASGDPVTPEPSEDSGTTPEPTDDSSATPEPTDDSSEEPSATPEPTQSE
ncbi:MAG: Ig-like domain-containing protein [Chloroflexota bacterium]